MSTADYSDMPQKTWEYNITPIPDGERITKISVSPKGIHCWYFNETRNVASFGGYSGHDGSFEEFFEYEATRVIPTDPGYYGVISFLKNMPEALLQEIKVYILKHKK